MKYLFTILVAAFLWGNANAQNGNKKLIINRLAGDFYIYKTYQTFENKPTDANGMYMVTNAGVVMFDTPWDTTQVIPLLDSIISRHRQKVVMCLATHSHEDRTGGFEILKREGIKTYATKKTDDLCKIKGEKRASNLIFKDTVFSVGNHIFETFYPGIGHTTDNIVVWFDNEKILYGGCFVKSGEATSLGNLKDANVPTWELSIKKVQNRYKNPLFVIPGHQSYKSKKPLENTLKLLKKYQEQKKE